MVLRDYLEQKRFYDAYMIIDDVWTELEDADEGIAGFEYNLLVTFTAGVGQREWRRILEAPNIPLSQKRDLVEAIHWNATHE